MMRTGDNLNTKEWAKLFHTYLQSDNTFYAGNFKHKEKISPLRTLPHEDAIDTSEYVEVLDYEKATAIIEGAKKFSIGICSCRHEKLHVGEKRCDVPLDTCSSFDTAADYMIHRTVTTVYVVPGAGDDAMLDHLAQAGVNIIAGTPRRAGLEAHWAASLSFDLLRSFVDEWPRFSTGEVGQAVTLPLQIMDANPEILSPGKQQLVEKILADVLAGYVDLGLEVETGPE